MLVADSDAVLLFDPNGNVIQTYSCAIAPRLRRPALRRGVDPSGTSFWTGDSASGDIWQIDIATGARPADDQTTGGLPLRALGRRPAHGGHVSPRSSPATPTALTIQPVSGDFSSPTPVSAVLTDSITDTPISGEPVTFTLNGAETCTADDRRHRHGDLRHHAG